MSDEELDYTPRPGRGRKAKPDTSSASRLRSGEDEGRDYTPRPARREQPARRTARKSPTSRSPKRLKLGSLVRSKLFLSIAAIGALLVLVVVPVIAELVGSRSAGSAADLTEQGNLYYDRGYQLWGTGNYEGAVEAFQKAAAAYEQALVQNPQDAQVRTDLGAVYFYLGRLQGDTALIEKAIRVWNVALEYEPDKPEALLNLGLGYAELGQEEQAIAMWQRVIEVAPESSSARYARQWIQEYSSQPTPTP